MKSAATSLEVKFQRDLNRIIDSDRSTRKRGLQKILDDVPWDSGIRPDEFTTFINETLLKLLMTTISDPIEKCRELTLLILQKIFSGEKLLCCENVHDLIRKLCQRIGENPFPEPAEELRLLLVEITSKLFRFCTCKSSNVEEISNVVLESLCKTLNDNFPAVKRSCAELISISSTITPKAVQLHLRSLLKGLTANVLHQHAKTRILSLKAIGNGITCATQAEYELLMNETVLLVFSRLLSDRSPSVKVELAAQCGSILVHRFIVYKQANMAMCNVDLDIMVNLLLLHGDDQKEVNDTARKWLDEVSANWSLLFKNLSEAIEPDIVDGEAALQSMEVVGAEKSIVGGTISSTSYQMIQDNFHELTLLMIRGVDEWTTEIKTRYLKGLAKLIEYGSNSFTTLLPIFFSSLGTQIKDDDNDVRISCEKCCTLIGQQINPSEILQILMPRVLGEVPGGDTSSQRTSAIRVLTHSLIGFPKYFEDSRNKDVPLVDAITSIEQISTALATSSLYEFRDAVIREAVLLLVRAIISSFPTECVEVLSVQRCIVLSLLYLSGKCPGEEDIVHEVAHAELLKYSSIVNSKAVHPVAEIATISSCVKTHFKFLFCSIVRAAHPLTSNAELLRAFHPHWEARSSGKAAFEVLIRVCPSEAWAHHKAVIPIFCNQVQPPAKPAAGTAEANALSYAAQRGEEVIPTSVSDHIDVRLSLLVLLEGFIRAGADDWQCGAYISEAAEGIVKEIIVPNLIWKIGRVEATVRKVALATAYGLLKAGATRAESLARSATDLVPLVVSNLDDMESTPRQIACLCLTVLFERLRGAFGDNAVREMYPKLIARLDDSNDAVRISACATLQMFLQCAHKSYFSGTTIDYILDQLFIHLDDPDPAIQEAVLPVIVIAANHIDKDLVVKKAENSKNSHRSSALCNRLLVDVQGFEILDD